MSLFCFLLTPSSVTSKQKRHSRKVITTTTVSTKTKVYTVSSKPEAQPRNIPPTAQHNYHITGPHYHYHASEPTHDPSQSTSNRPSCHDPVQRIPQTCCRGSLEHRYHNLSPNITGLREMRDRGNLIHDRYYEDLGVANREVRSERLTRLRGGVLESCSPPSDRCPCGYEHVSEGNHDRHRLESVCSDADFDRLDLHLRRQRIRDS